MALTTNRGNRICIYHHHVKVTKRQQDEEDEGSKKFKVTGMPYPRTITKTKGGHGRGSRQAGQFNCGCPEEAALWDFYFWKTMVVTNEDGIAEGLTSAQRIEPRMRLFFIQRYLSDTTLTLDDLYTHGKSPLEVEKRLVQTQIQRLKRRLHILNGKDEQGK